MWYGVRGPHNFWGAPVAQTATTMFGTKVLPATYYRSHCGNSLYYRTSRDHELYTLLYNLSQCPVHYPVKFDADIFIQSGVIDVFLFTYLKIQDGGGRHLDFQVMWIWLLRRDDTVVFVFCTKFGSNICYSYRDRRTYASDIFLMTSRELTFGFDFWSVVISALPWCIFP